MPSISLLAATLFVPPAIAEDPLPSSYNGVYAVDCLEAELVVEVFASRGFMGLDADLATEVHVPLSCDGASDQELIRFETEGVDSCIALTGDAPACAELVSAIGDSANSLNARFDSRIPDSMVLTSRYVDSDDPKVRTRGHHQYANGRSRHWSYDLDPQTGQFERLGLRAPELDVEVFEQMGMDCETWGATDLRGHMDPFEGYLHSSVESRPSAVCSLPFAGTEVVVELFGTYRGTVEGQRVSGEGDEDPWVTP